LLPLFPSVNFSHIKKAFGFYVVILHAQIYSLGNWSQVFFLKKITGKLKLTLIFGLSNYNTYGYGG